MNDLYHCAMYLHQKLNDRKVPYYFLGGFACINVAMTARTTADIDIAVPNGQEGYGALLDIFAHAPFVQDTEGIISQDAYFFFVESTGRFVEVDGVLAGFMAFPRIEDAGTIEVENLDLKFLNPIGLLRLKLSSWANKTRRSSSKRDGDIVNISSIRHLLIQNEEKMILKELDSDAAKGLRAWIREFRDLKTWKLLDPTYKGR